MIELVNIKELDIHRLNELSTSLLNLTPRDRGFFNPHNFSLDSMIDLKLIENHYYFAVYNNQNLIGYCMLRKFDSFSTPTIGYVVWERYRGQGYSHQIVDNLVSLAQVLRYRKVLASVNPVNDTSVNLLRKHGFVFIGQRNDTITHENDQLWYLREIKPLYLTED